jgi:hypothetical protein
MIQSFIGHMTHMWEVEHDGDSYILKDAWVEHSYSVSEAIHLNNIEEMEGIPMLFCAEDITIDGVLLSTGCLHHGIYSNTNLEWI